MLPYLIEFNVRMGDPECQVILPRLKTDIVKLILKSVNNKLKNIKIDWKQEKSMTIVLCSKGYPGRYKKNIEIKNINKVEINKKSFLFHAGTKFEHGRLLSNGGRVLNITSMGKKFKIVRRNIIKILKSLDWKSGFFRRDIGKRVME